MGIARHSTSWRNYAKEDPMTRLARGLIALLVVLAGVGGAGGESGWA
jgi:hypothetical protein